MSTHGHHRVVAGILLRDRRALLCHRRDDLAWYPSAWDLVGGHLEPDETEVQALARECWEELAVDICDAGEALRVTTADAELTVFRVRAWTGEPVNAAPEEHQCIAWFDALEISGLALADERIGPLLRDALREQ